MRRSTLDKLFSIGGGLLALLLLVLGLVLQNQANFASDYVTDQLGEQKISFTPADFLSDEEKAAPCLVANAGKPLTTGSQAECYANEYIGLHVKGINDGKTYAETSTESREAKAAADEALESAPDDPATEELVAASEVLSGKTESLFRGETLRGLLLTTYGFTIFGERAAQAAMVAFAAGIVLLLASIAGFVHAFTTSKDDIVE